MKNLNNSFCPNVDCPSNYACSGEVVGKKPFGKKFSLIFYLA